MRAFSGMEVRPYCQTSDMPLVKIDRVRVVAYKTVFGKVEFALMGRMGAMGAEWPIERPKESFDEVWESKEGVEKQIEQARREESERAAKRYIQTSDGAVCGSGDCGNEPIRREVPDARGGADAAAGCARDAE